MQAGEEELRLSANISRNNKPYGGGGAELVQPEDRARLVPMTSFANKPYWSDLNNFSNMVPMPAALRLGPWLRLEQQLNRAVSSGEELYVVAGPVYLIINLSRSLADLEPAAYFKLVADESGTAAFLFPKDMQQTGRFCSQTVNLAEIQDMTDIEFFPGRTRTRQSRQLLDKLGCP